MNEEALIRRIHVTVPPASLEDTASDWERLERATRSSLCNRPVEATLPALREIGLGVAARKLAGYGYACGDWKRLAGGIHQAGFRYVSSVRSGH